ncbi:MAG TPA: NAD-dependent epimerase/dehydratase family protein [Acidimicrobiales bacterium]
MGRRVLVTGADTFWGGRVVQALEDDRDTDVVLGLGSKNPSVPFERAEYVRSDQTYSILNRLVRATQVDTIVHTFLVVDSTQVPSRALHEINVIGTMNLLAAAGAPGSPVRHVVVKSSTLVYGSTEKDPNTFGEDTPRSKAARTGVERSLIEAEALVHDFVEENPSVAVTLLRFANVLGTDIVTAISKNLSRPACPSIFGFDPLVQFVEEDDVVRAIEFVTRNRVPGVFNVAGAGRLPWSEVASICGTRLLPLPPVRPALAIAPLVRLRVFEFPPELEALLRYGRGVDTHRLVAAGFDYRYTSAGAVENFVRGVRLRRGTGRTPVSYTYEHDVEQFFRHSPSIVHSTET